jgi:hypothetical protein
MIIAMLGQTKCSCLVGFCYGARVIVNGDSRTWNWLLRCDINDVALHTGKSLRCVWEG